MSVCSKFIPNFFNKNKCQNCFKLKTCHNDQNLEKSQTVRTIVRCSFLFVTQESTVNTAFKVRKWQRRWFILYSDGKNGEITYALDQSSLTLPQNRLNLTECERICLAPEVHEYAIAIVYLGTVYYIRANHAEEMRRWYDDLCQFINNFEKQSSNVSNNNLTTNNNNLHIKHCIVVDAVTKEPSNNLTINHPPINSQPINNQQNNNQQFNENQINHPVDNSYHQINNGLINNSINNQSNSSNTSNNFNNQVQPKLRSNKNKSNPIFKLLSYVNDKKVNDHCVDCSNQLNDDKIINELNNENNLNIQNVTISDSDKIYVNKSTVNSSSVNNSSNVNSVKINNLSNDLEDNSNDHLNNSSNNCVNKFKNFNDSHDDTSINFLKNQRSNNLSDQPDYYVHKLTNQKDDKSSKIYQLNKSLPDLRTEQVLDYKKQNQTKDKETSSIEQLNSNQMINQQSINHLDQQSIKNETKNKVKQNIDNNVKIIKTGWLMRKGKGTEKGHNNGQWFRHWFVLKDTLLTYYRDQYAELNSSALLDGVFDLALVKRVQLNNCFMVNQNSNLIYWPFVITTYNDKQHELAALSNNCRDEWIKLIVNSQSQINSISATKVDFLSKDQKELMNGTANLNTSTDQQVCKKRLTYETSKEQFEKKDTDAESSDSSSVPPINGQKCNSGQVFSDQMPSSPPLNRNALSRMKHKIKENNKYSNKYKSIKQETNQLNQLNLFNSSNTEKIGRNDHLNSPNSVEASSNLSTESTNDSDSSVNNKIDQSSDLNSSNSIELRTEHDSPLNNDSGLVSGLSGVSGESVNSSIVNKLLSDLNETFKTIDNNENSNETSKLSPKNSFNVISNSKESNKITNLNRITQIGSNKTDKLTKLDLVDGLNENVLKSDQLKTLKYETTEKNKSNGLSALNDLKLIFNESIESESKSNGLITSTEQQYIDKFNEQIKENSNEKSKNNELNELNQATDEDNELSRIKFSIVELHKFCLNIINELQLTHSDLSDLKRNLIQKDIFSLLLGNHLLNGVNGSKPFVLENFIEIKNQKIIDTFTGQLLDTLMSNLFKKQDEKTDLSELNKDYKANLSASTNSSLSPTLNQTLNQTLNSTLNQSINLISNPSFNQSVNQTLDQPTHQVNNKLSNQSSFQNRISTTNRSSSSVSSSSNSSVNASDSLSIKSTVNSLNDRSKIRSTNRSIDKSIDKLTDNSPNSPTLIDESDKIYLTRKQFDTLLNKNEQLEQRLRISLKALQSLNNELKESFQNYDHLEIAFCCMQNRFKSILNIKKEEYELMQQKINYLTSKLLQVEKAYRLSLSKLAELQTAT